MQCISPLLIQNGLCLRPSLVTFKVKLCSLPAAAGQAVAEGRPEFYTCYLLVRLYSVPVAEERAVFYTCSYMSGGDFLPSAAGQSVTTGQAEVLNKYM